MRQAWIRLWIYNVQIFHSLPSFCLNVNTLYFRLTFEQKISLSLFFSLHVSVNPLLSLGAYFVFFESTVFSITVFAVCSAVTYVFVICSHNKESEWVWVSSFLTAHQHIIKRVHLVNTHTHMALQQTFQMNFSSALSASWSTSLGKASHDILLQQTAESYLLAE